MPLESLVISPEQLDQLDHKAIVYIDCRFSLSDPQLGQQQYLTGHIPGAYYLDLNQDLSGSVLPHGGRHPLPDWAILAAKLNRMGITAETLVVAYDDSRFAFAARLWWLLNWMGHDQVVVLDGGFTAYKALNLTITADSSPEQSGAFVPQIRQDWIVNLQEVQLRQQNPAAAIIDSREDERYRGKREPIDPVAGHIPGALNYPWQNVTDEAGQLRSAEELKAYWSDLAAAQEIVVYCGSGVTACVNLLALAVAQIPTGRLYPGSWSDWCSYPLDEAGQPILS